MSAQDFENEYKKEFEEKEDLKIDEMQKTNKNVLRPVPYVSDKGLPILRKGCEMGMKFKKVMWWIWMLWLLP